MRLFRRYKTETVLAVAFQSDEQATPEYVGELPPKADWVRDGSVLVLDWLWRHGRLPAGKPPGRFMVVPLVRHGLKDPPPLEPYRGLPAQPPTFIIPDTYVLPWRIRASWWLNAAGYWSVAMVGVDLWVGHRLHHTLQYAMAGFQAFYAGAMFYCAKMQKRRQR